MVKLFLFAGIKNLKLICFKVYQKQVKYDKVNALKILKIQAVVW